MIDTNSLDFDCPFTQGAWVVDGNVYRVTAAPSNFRLCFRDNDVLSVIYVGLFAAFIRPAETCHILIEKRVNRILSVWRTVYLVSDVPLVAKESEIRRLLELLQLEIRKLMN